ncbi:flavodoxin family protein [Anaerotignum sp.]
MKVLLINGSPNGHGCTYTALKEIEKTLRQEGIETEMFYLGNKPIGGCTGCASCRKTGKCVQDDIVNKLLPKALAADAMVLGAPVHYASAAGQASSAFDRLFMMSNGGFANKLGAAVVSCRRGGASATFDQLNKYFTISNMPVVSGTYWNQVHGNTPDEVKQDLEGMQNMRAIGRNMAWLLKCIEAGKNAGIELPFREEKIKTNFIG